MAYRLFILFLLLSQYIFSQSLPDYNKIVLSQSGDYALAEPAVMQAATYCLLTPYNRNDFSRLSSMQFLVKWMSNTPDFSYKLGQNYTKSFNNNTDLLGLYMAAMAEYSLENRAAAKDPDTLQLNALSVVLTYCENPSNNMSLTVQMKKLSEAKANGQLQQAIK